MPLVSPSRFEEGVVAIGDDVDDRIADREHVEAGFGHGEAFDGGKARPLAAGGSHGQPRPRNAASPSRHGREKFVGVRAAMTRVA